MASMRMYYGRNYSVDMQMQNQKMDSRECRLQFKFNNQWYRNFEIRYLWILFNKTNSPEIPLKLVNTG